MLDAAPDRQPHLDLVGRGVAYAEHRCRDAVGDAANEILVSTAALWELSIKVSSGKLTLPDDLEVMLTNLGFLVLSIGFRHLRRISTLPRVHRDPFDRMMIAQALAEQIPVVTRDRIFARYGVPVVW